MLGSILMLCYVHLHNHWEKELISIVLWGERATARVGLGSGCVDDKVCSAARYSYPYLLRSRSSMHAAICFLLTSLCVGSVIRCKVNCVWEFLKKRCIKLGPVINSISFVITDEYVFASNYSLVFMCFVFILWYEKKKLKFAYNGVVVQSYYSWFLSRYAKCQMVQITWFETSIFRSIFCAFISIKLIEIQWDHAPRRTPTSSCDKV
jgi:hypothetical protein